MFSYRGADRNRPLAQLSAAIFLSESFGSEDPYSPFGIAVYHPTTSLRIVSNFDRYERRVLLLLAFHTPHFADQVFDAVGGWRNGLRAVLVR